MPATHPNALHQRTISNFSSHHGHHVSVASTDEDLFSSITGLDDLVGEEDDLSFDDGFDGDDLTSNKNSTGASKRKIRAASTAEKKATHNAVERARRESLNARFLVLADMLPGMTQVKRASKAAIVNKSIDLITDMQLTEARMSKENASLKAELDALRLRLNSNDASSSALSQPASSAPASVQQQQQQHQALFAGMPHHLQMQAAVAAAAAGMPMMHNMPPNAAAAAAMASAAAMQAHHHHAAQAQVQAQQAAHMNMNNMNAQAHAQVQAAQAQAQAQAAHAHLQAQFNAAAAAAAASSTTTSSATPSADMGHQLFPGIFSGLFTNNATTGTFDALESARSESGSPASLGGASAHSTASHPFSHGLFDLPPMTGFSTEGNGNNNINGSPGSISYASPPGTVASLAGSERTAGTSQAGGTAASSASGGALTHNTAPSPASSNGIPTPSNNAYSPLGLPTLSTATPQLSHASSTSNSQNNSNSNNVTGMDPAIAAFDGSADAAYLAAQFAPNDLAKAQQELQAFIAYQHRMAFGGGDSSSSASQHNSSSSQQMQQQQQQQPPTPTLEHGHRSSSVSLSQQQQQQQMSPTLYTPSGSAFTFPPQQQQQQQQHQHQQQQQHMSYPAAAIAGMCGPQAAQASMAGVPAWQMMMAQHQAMVAAYGQQPHF